MNIEYLESSLPPDTVRQLREGIPIADLAEYNSVLSTFSEFALEQSEAM
jgi:forespore regulator of the sigma-K checkpoint